MEQTFPNRKSTLSKICDHQSATSRETTQCCNDIKNLTTSLIICFHLKIVND